MIPAEVSCTPCMISQSHFSFLAIKASPHYHSSTEKKYFEIRVLSLSIYLSGLHIFQKYCMRQPYKPSSAESAGNSNMFYQGQRTPLFPGPCPHIGLSHCSFLCCIYPFTICQTPLQNLPCFLPQKIIFSFLAPLRTLLFFPDVNCKLTFSSPISSS